MITLKTLPEATEQEVFDQVVTHLLTQNKPAKLERWVRCFYRTPDGLSCAGGCLISDDEIAYLKENGLLSVAWSVLVMNKAAPLKHCGLIETLQKVHDCTPPELWHRNLESIASANNLRFNPPKVSE